MTDHTTRLVNAGEGANGSWMRMTRRALGLSADDLAFILGLRTSKEIRSVWERDKAPIPPGVVAEIQEFATTTDTTVNTLIHMADRIDEPAIILYASPEEIPADHIAAAYGPGWWDHVAARVAAQNPDTFTGSAHDVASLYPYPSRDIHDHPCVMHVPDTQGLGTLRALRRQTLKEIQ